MSAQHSVLIEERLLPVMFKEARGHDIFLIPDIVISGRVISIGRVISEEELENMIIEELGTK